MPNWVTSKLKIEGPNSADIMKSLISFNEAKEVYFDFNKITPMPDELNIVSGSLTDRSIELYLTSINPDVKHIGIKNTDYELFNKQRELANQGKKFGTYKDNLSQDEIEEFVKRNVNGDNLNELKDLLEYGRKAVLNVERFGAMDWYSWSIEHWGTKWNACHNFYDIENSPSEIMFDTAWGNVADLIAKLSSMYPENEFHFEFAEEWIGNQCGNSCASLLLSKGVGMKEIQEWLGHSTYNTTADIYSHLSYSSKIGVANAINNVFGDKNKTTLDDNQLSEEDRKEKLESIVPVKVKSYSHRETTKTQEFDLSQVSPELKYEENMESDLDEELKELEELIKQRKQILKKKMDIEM